MILRYKLLKCVKEIPSCHELHEGDLLWKRSYEVDENGYEYVVCIRWDDNARIKFRVEHLSECFDEVVQETDVSSPSGIAADQFGVEVEKVTHALHRATRLS